MNMESQYPKLNRRATLRKRPALTPGAPARDCILATCSSANVAAPACRRSAECRSWPRAVGGRQVRARSRWRQRFCACGSSARRTSPSHPTVGHLRADARPSNTTCLAPSRPPRRSNCGAPGRPELLVARAGPASACRRQPSSWCKREGSSAQSRRTALMLRLHRHHQQDQFSYDESGLLGDFRSAPAVPGLLRHGPV